MELIKEGRYIRIFSSKTKKDCENIALFNMCPKLIDFLKITKTGKRPWAGEKFLKGVATGNRTINSVFDIQMTGIFSSCVSELFIFDANPMIISFFFIFFPHSYILSDI